MKDKNAVSVGQFVLLLLAGRVSNCLLLPADSLHALSVPDVLLVTVLNAVVLLFLLLPTCWALRHSPHQSLTERAGEGSAFAGRAVGFGYLLLYTMVLGFDMIQFTDFAEKTVKAEFSVNGMTLLVLTVCLLASFYGVEALGRTSTAIAVLSVLCLLFFGLMLLPQTERMNFPPATVSKASVIMQQVLRELPRTTEVVAVGTLFPHIKDKQAKGCIWFVVLNAVLSFSVCITATGVLGDFASSTAYPYYAAVSVVHLGLLPRMDLVITALWLGTFFVRFTLFFWLFMRSFQSVFGKRTKYTAAGCVAGLLVLILWGFQQRAFQSLWQQITVVYGVALLFFCVVLPLILSKRRKGT